MEPVKFEEHIKSQLQKREIKPSAGSWEKLQGRLEHKEKPGRPQFWWIGVAAAIAVVFFMLGTLFNNPIEQDNPVVVEKPSEEVIEKTIPEKRTEEVLIARQDEEEVKAPETEKLPKKVKPKTNALAEVVPERTKQEAVPAEVEEIPTTYNPEMAVAENSKTPSEVSDGEIEALLMLANAEIENDPAYAVQTVKADDLLEEVEEELDQSFRQKVFEVIKDGFSKAKTAVAQRNY